MMSEAEKLCEVALCLKTLNDPIYNDEINEAHYYLSRAIVHRDLFRLFEKSTTHRFKLLDQAFNYYSKNSILVHVKELDRYGMYTFEEYCQFVNDIAAHDEICGVAIRFTPKQIIPTTSEQRMVISCLTVNAAALSKVLREYFNTTIQHTTSNGTITELMLSITYPNYQRCYSAYIIFCADCYNLGYGHEIATNRQVGSVRYVKKHIASSGITDYEIRNILATNI